MLIFVINSQNFQICLDQVRQYICLYMYCIMRIFDKKE